MIDSIDSKRPLGKKKQCTKTGGTVRTEQKLSRNALREFRSESVKDKAG